MRRLVQLAALIATVGLLAACATNVTPSPLPTPTPTTRTEPTTAESASAPEPFTLYTHCGIGGFLIEYDGDSWQATGPGPLDDGAGNAPPGFGRNHDEGSIVRLDTEHATYRSSEGVVLNLERLDERPDVRYCF